MARISGIQTYEAGGLAFDRNWTFEALAADPTGAGLWEGRAWFNTTDNFAKYFDGTAVQAFPQGGGGTGDVLGNYVGAAATFAALPATDTDGSAVDNGDWAILNADDGTNPRGIYVSNGTAYTLALRLSDAGAATTVAAGVVRLATAAEVAAGTAGDAVPTVADVVALANGRAGSQLIGDGTVGPFSFNHNIAGVVADERLIVQMEWTASGETYSALWDNSTTAITVSPVAAIPNNGVRVTWVKAGT